MFRLNNIKQNMLIVTIAALLTGCGGGGGSSDSTAVSSDSTTETTVTEKVVSVPANAILVTEDSATIDITSWIENGYTVTEVIYGTTNKYGSTLLVNDESTITLDNLQANTTYHYKIVAKDNRDKKIVSRDQTFTTLEKTTEPIVTEPAPTEPTTEEPAPTEPTTEEPAPTEPTTEEPAPTEPTTEEPAPTEPTTEEPAPTEPTTEEPAPTEPTPEEPAPTEPTPEPAPICQSGPAMQQGQVKDSISGTGLENVTVTINGCITTTDAQGFYTLNNIAISDRAVVTFKHDAYYKNSEIIQIDQYSEGTTDLSSNYTVVEMDKYISHWTYDSQTAVSGGHIVIPAGIYINKDGSPYIGQVTAGLSYRTSAEKATDIEFPGEYKGKDSNGVIIPFVSYGFTVIDLIDMNGATLSVSQNITLKFEATGATENIIPLWYYNYEQEIWIEEGYAERQSDGTYNGEVSHPGTWSLNKPIEADSGIYRGRIIYSDGITAKDVRVYAIGDNWVKTDLSTDQDGMFEIEVIPGSSFQLTAYNYKHKYDAIHNGTIPAIASGEIVEDRI